ncbi:transcription antitermination factor NusB [Candidatus Adlerbacteria bacterium RIFCSPHIGHO2_02_FULL_54_18]|uniref:Transcription antitermination protein NusB n=2 Tax=Candidatus Adleribacteriota TaxID=1752736 RepID=A0A1F4Y453_9BACT|nr:MAG: transcription antitermination factor NusB [Candidatus Adlerbacteria bacterium RIFCSPLOWO2_01_FULL_54_21b]OGC88654.1 MAG: transcription antitermination factor NusB [Candidatus Adlerbacteria bacterium RIFCSPHIGHO2_02_FULL_54_18]
MANRHLSRSVVLQTLFEWDFRQLSTEAAKEALARNASEFAPAAGDLPFMGDLLAGAITRKPDLDLVIGKAAPEWSIERIAPVDRNVLRLGLFELLFADRDKVPAKVAINEAIELAKSFGGEHSGRFINGVLGAVYKELGEPGKDEVSKKKKDVPYEQMPVQRLGGAVVYARQGSEVYLALVHDIFGHWTLSKGKIGDAPEIAEESTDEGTIRSIKEELGLDITIKEKLGENEYVASDPATGKKRKHVTYFLAEAPFSEVKLEQKGGLDDARWFRLQDALDLNFYEDMFPIIEKAVQHLTAKPITKTKI